MAIGGNWKRDSRFSLRVFLLVDVPPTEIHPPMRIWAVQIGHEALYKQEHGPGWIGKWLSMARLQGWSKYNQNTLYTF